MTRRLAKKIIRRVRRGDDVGYTMDQRYAVGQRMWRAFMRDKRARYKRALTRLPSALPVLLSVKAPDPKLDWKVKMVRGQR